MELEISTRLRNALIKAGITSFEQAAQYPKRFWLSRPLVSHGLTNELRALLRSKGLDFAKPRTEYIEPDRKRELGEIAELKNSRWTTAIQGDVYFIRAGEFDFIKIGFCKSGGIKSRMETLQIGCPFELKLVGIVRGGGREMEKRLHKSFATNKIRGEWFKVTPAIASIIQENPV